MDAFSNDGFAWIVLAILWIGCISYFNSRYFFEHDKFYDKTVMMYALSVASIFATVVFFISSWRKFRGIGPKSNKRKSNRDNRFFAGFMRKTGSPLCAWPRKSRSDQVNWLITKETRIKKALQKRLNPLFDAKKRGLRKFRQHIS